MGDSESPALIAYTDGGCRGNPGIGSWAFVLVNPATGTALERTGGERETTNNRMELMGPIEALRALRRDQIAVTIHSDSQYVVKGMTEWVRGWQKRGWRKADGKPVLNADLWQVLVAEAARHRVRWQWVEGHAGHQGNERVDLLANQAMDRMQRGEDPAWEQRGTWPMDQR